MHFAHLVFDVFKCFDQQSKTQWDSLYNDIKQRKNSKSSHWSSCNRRMIDIEIKSVWTLSFEGNRSVIFQSVWPSSVLPPHSHVWFADLTAALSSRFSSEPLSGDLSSVPLRLPVPRERCCWDELELPSELMSVPEQLSGGFLWRSEEQGGRSLLRVARPSFGRDQLLSHRRDQQTVYSQLVVSDMFLLWLTSQSAPKSVLKLTNKAATGVSYRSTCCM